MWMARSAQEFEWSSRTWMITFTLTAPEQLKLEYQADIERHGKCSVPLLSLPAHERFYVLAQQGAGLLTKYFKRLRENTGENFRYLLVAERHKSGLPHWHALLHEYGNPILKRTIQENWKLGFTTCKLVSDARGCAYVSKYLGKDNGGRVRASVGYGTAEYRPMAYSDAEGSVHNAHTNKQPSEAREIF